ncbi:hypothetical protein CDD81_2807 [Ophiocordyceps australis]|uniref:Helicase C-terminal domain-containing protein n=1 Tax=Ophiocordyceps australis TaxID=1399860 RepID=A0A2C5XXD4_9HYPO|nr:hypothetical protein CDD81_2807 [Ophiocordyceps australis]
MPGRDANKVQINAKEDDVECFLAATYAKGCTLTPGTKLLATMAVLTTWLLEHPEDKIIVFYQFVPTGMMLGCMLEQAGFQDSFLYYAGTMSQKQRAEALDEFKSNAERKVLVASMKCGGQSLNLTVANRVIIVDPWWNTVTEKQAFGRVVRIGQQKAQLLVRICVPAPIEHRMLQLQVQKAKDVAHALQDDRPRHGYESDEDWDEEEGE